MDEKLGKFLDTMRTILAEIIAAIEDYRSVAYDESLLYRRRKKVSSGKG